MPLILPPALLFFSNALLFISFFTRLPEIQLSLGIDKTVLGLTLLGAPLGTFVALPVAGRITNRLTPRLTAVVSLAVYSLLIPLLALAPLVGFFAAFTAVGFARTVLDVASNMVATGIEQRHGIKVIARSHGFWSVGLLAGSLMSGWLAALGVTPAYHLMLASLVVLAVAALAAAVMPRDSAAAQVASGVRTPVFVMPAKPIMLVALMVIGLAVIEGAVYDWGIFFLKERVDPDPSVAATLFAFFTIGMGATRLLGDRLRDVFSAPALVRASAVAVACGLLLLLNADGPLLAGLALVVIGAGVALNMPIAIATTINLSSSRSTAENIAALSFTLLISTLGLPALLGFVAEQFGIAASFAILLPLTLLSLALAPISGGRPLVLRSGRG